MKKKSVIILLLIIILSVFFILKNKKSNPNELTLYGNVEIRQVDMSFQVAGQIEKLLKEEGDTVKKGELIALLDNRDYIADYEKATADVDRALALQNDAVSKFNRNAPLVAGNTISKQEYDTLSNTKDKTIADYKASVANQTYAKNQLDYTKLYAKDDGIIMTRVQEEGATVAKGQTVYSISKTKPVWIRAYVNETELGNIKYGMKVKVFTDTINPITGKNRQYNGYIGYISPIAEFTPKTVQSTDLRTSLVYRIRVYIDDIDDFLRQGMPATIKIDLKSLENRHELR